MSNVQTTTPDFQMPDEDALLDMLRANPDGLADIEAKLHGAPADTQVAETATEGQDGATDGSTTDAGTAETADPLDAPIDLEALKPNDRRLLEERLAEKERRRAAEERAAALEREVAELKGYVKGSQRFAPVDDTPPDPFADDPMPDAALQPREFAEWQARQLARVQEAAERKAEEKLAKREAELEATRLLEEDARQAEAAKAAVPGIDTQWPAIADWLNSRPSMKAVCAEEAAARGGNFYLSALRYYRAANPTGATPAPAAAAAPVTTPQTTAGGKFYTADEVQALIKADRVNTIKSLAANGGQLTRAPGLTSIPAASLPDNAPPTADDLPSEDDLLHMSDAQRAEWDRKLRRR